MKNKFQKKIVNIFVLIFCILLLFWSLFVLVQHIDYFSTRLLTTTTNLSLEKGESDDKLGAFAKFSFIDLHKKKTISKQVFIENYFYEEVNQNKQFEIYYTKYLNQVFIKGYKNPTILIFLLDMIRIVLFSFGVLVGLKPSSKKARGNND